MTICCAHLLSLHAVCLSAQQSHGLQLCLSRSICALGWALFGLCLLCQLCCFYRLIHIEGAASGPRCAAQYVVNVYCCLLHACITLCLGTRLNLALHALHGGWPLACQVSGSQPPVQGSGGPPYPPGPWTTRTGGLPWWCTCRPHSLCVPAIGGPNPLGPGLPHYQCCSHWPPKCLDVSIAGHDGKVTADPCFVNMTGFPSRAGVGVSCACVLLLVGVQVVITDTSGKVFEPHVLVFKQL